MTLIPAFEIGVCNAWIFMLYNFLPMPLLVRFLKNATALRSTAMTIVSI